MSQVDVFINRMLSQRGGINFAAAQTVEMPGPNFVYRHHSHELAQSATGHSEFKRFRNRGKRGRMVSGKHGDTDDYCAADHCFHCFTNTVCGKLYACRHKITGISR